MSEPLSAAASTTRQPSARPLIRRLRRGKFAGERAACRAGTRRPARRARRARARARGCARDRRCPVPVPTHGDAARGAREPAAMRRRVDAEREPAHDREPGVAQRLRERLGVGHALRGRVAAADDRERRRVQQLDAALDVEERRRIGDLQQAGADSRDRRGSRCGSPGSSSQRAHAATTASVSASRAIAAATASRDVRASAAAPAASMRCGIAEDGEQPAQRARRPGPATRLSLSHAARSSSSGMGKRAPGHRGRVTRRAAPCARARDRRAAQGLVTTSLTRDLAARLHDEAERRAVEGAEHHHEPVALVGQLGDLGVGNRPARW